MINIAIQLLFTYLAKLPNTMFTQKYEKQEYLMEMEKLYKKMYIKMFKKLCNRNNLNVLWA